MVEDQQKVFEEILKDGGAVLAEAFMQNMVLSGNGGNNEELHLYDVVYEDMVNDVKDEDELFDHF